MADTVNNFAFTGAATVDTNYTTLATVIVGRDSAFDSTSSTNLGARPRGYQVNFEIANASGQALSDTRIQLQDHPDGEWYSYVGGADFTTATLAGNVLFATQTQKVTTAATANSGHAHVRINAAYSFRIQTKLAAASGTVTVYGNIRAA